MNNVASKIIIFLLMLCLLYNCLENESNNFKSSTFILQPQKHFYSFENSLGDSIYFFEYFHHLCI